MIGFSELIGSWLVILGLLTPLGTLALAGTMATAAYQHIFTAGLNISLLELVVLHLGGSLLEIVVSDQRYGLTRIDLPMPVYCWAKTPSLVTAPLLWWPATCSSAFLSAPVTSTPETTALVLMPGLNISRDDLPCHPDAAAPWCDLAK